MYEESIRLLDEYAEALLAESPGEFDGRYVAEVRSRLRQMDFLLDRVRQAERDSVDAMGRSRAVFAEFVDATPTTEIATSPAPDALKMTSSEFGRWQRAEMELTTFTEAFYFFAHRARQILRKGLVPGIKSFEVPGVRGVRNHLIEHPEKKAGVVEQSWQWDGPNGPHLKSVRSSNDARFRDPGLYANAQEFADQFEHRVASAMATLKA